MTQDTIQVERFSVFFRKEPILREVTLNVRRNEVLGIIGPARSGKSTFLRALSRTNELIPGMTHRGRILLDGAEIHGDDVNIADHRRRVGMVYAVPVALPKSIFENIVFGPRLKGIRDRQTLDALVEKSLKAASLWDEVKDRLQSSALRLSGGQQQRLCIARALALEPEVLLLDEPCSGLDPISTLRIEETLTELKESLTVVLVTNNVMQSARVADRTAFFLMGELIELDDTKKIFTNPAHSRTNDYVTGRFG
jgi:phosphate transport system ATP-binding protein